MEAADAIFRVLEGYVNKLAGLPIIYARHGLAGISHLGKVVIFGDSRMR
jgi:hypothetical protein